MNSIITLEDYKIASFNLKSSKADDGTIENTTLDGTRYGIYNFIDNEHELKLEYLTSAELEGIKTEYLMHIKNNTNPSFAITYLEKFDFIQAGDIASNVAFMITAKGYKAKQNKLPKMYDLTIKLTQRVVL